MLDFLIKTLIRKIQFQEFSKKTSTAKLNKALQVLIKSAYRIYSKERLCSKERLPQTSAPFLAWNI